MDYGLSEAVTARILLAETWNPILVLAGCREPNLLPENIFSIAGAILRDKEVRQMRTRAEFQIRAYPGHAAFATNWEQLFEAMGPAGRAALCERVNNARRK